MKKHAKRVASPYFPPATRSLTIARTVSEESKK
jgi:hypothetical protein